MSDKPTSDIVMRFVDKNGRPVWAESALGVLKDDPFMEGFDPISSYDDYSNFFEVTTFSFTVAVKPKDEAVSTLSQAPRGSLTSGRSPASTDQFSRWRSATDEDYKKLKFPIEFDEFSFSRVIDGASPAFFSACCNQESFRSATLVRRIATGTRGGAQRQAAGFLRLEFKDVLLTGINWDDGELVTESVTFICKALRVRYRQQTADAGLKKETEAVWDQNRDGMTTTTSGSGST